MTTLIGPDIVLCGSRFLFPFGFSGAQGVALLSAPLGTMPPKKKAKTTRSFEEVPSAQAALDQWLQSVYRLRHRGEDDVATHPWPVLHGGTFLEIAGRASEDEDRLVTAAHRLCQKAGVVDQDFTVDNFKAQFMQMQAGWAMPTMFKRVKVTG